MRYVCSIYKDRPSTCVGYPWNIANQIFPDCQFYKKDDDRLLSMEEVQADKTDEEISDYCVKCGRCCFFGPAACSKLRIISDDNEGLERI
jgi:Fe-S-cluster containining protein